MTILNRCAVFVRPRQPYLDWMRHDDEGDTEEAFHNMYADPIVFLYEDDDGRRSPQVGIGSVWPAIFEHMLLGWCQDPAYWPPDRTRRMFEQWFDCDFGSEVNDLGALPLHFDG